MIRSPILTTKRRENLVRLITNAATIIFAGLVVGSFIGGGVHLRRLLIGTVLYLVTVATIWWLEP